MIRRILAGIGALALIGGLAACGVAGSPAAVPTVRVTQTVMLRAAPVVTKTAAPTPAMTKIVAPVASATPTPVNSDPYIVQPSTLLTPQQALAAAVVGGTDSVTGATVVSATVGTMCSSSYAITVIFPYAAAGFPCSSNPGNVPISQWNQPGVDSTATGELQMSDGDQNDVVINVDQSGNITWSPPPSSCLPQC